MTGMSRRDECSFVLTASVSFLGNRGDRAGGKGQSGTREFRFLGLRECRKRRLFGTFRTAFRIPYRSHQNPPGLARRSVRAVEKTNERHAPVSITPTKDGFDRRVIWREEDTGRKFVKASKKWREVR